MAADTSMDIRIHPLVILHVADHFTREAQQNNKTMVLGALMGEQQGRLVNVVDAFEILYTIKDKQILVDTAAFEEDRKLFQEAYKTYECLGWYCTGVKVEPHHALIHKVMQGYNERPFFVLFDPRPDVNARELPLAVYEEVVHVAGDKVSNDFVQTAYKIESEEAERVTAVHCAKVISNVDTGSVVPPHYTGLRGAVETLNTRVKVIHQFLKDVQQGKVEADHKILRQVKGLCNRLPTMNSPDFKNDFLSEYNDAMLVTYLATITRSTTMVNEVVDKFNTAFATNRRRGGFF